MCLGNFPPLVSSFLTDSHREILDFCKHFISSNPNLPGEIIAQAHDPKWNNFLYSIITPKFAQSLQFVNSALSPLLSSFHKGILQISHMI